VKKFDAQIDYLENELKRTRGNNIHINSFKYVNDCILFIFILENLQVKTEESSNN